MWLRLRHAWLYLRTGMPDDGWGRRALESWRADAVTHEAQKSDRELTLSEGFKAGVLSEDSVYDVVTDMRDAAFDMLELGTDILKTWI